MKIVSRYILRHFFPVFLLALAGFTGLYFIIDFFEKVDNLLEKQVPFQIIFSYFLYKIPYIMTQGIPMAALLAALISLGLLKRNRELIALETAGINTGYYIRPIVLAALFLSLAHFAVDEAVARSLNQKAQQIWQQRVQNSKASVSMTRENIWYHGQGVIYQICSYDPNRQTLERVSLFFLNPQFKLEQRMDARNLRWDQNQWVAEDGLLITLHGSDSTQEWFSEKRLELQETPEDFAGLETVPEDLDWLDLYAYAKKIRLEGYNSLPYEVQLHMRLAFPLTTFILTILGISIVLGQGIHGGIAAAVGIGLIVASLYLTVLQIGCALATAGILFPFIGVWAGDIIFSALTGYLWITHCR